jgi:uncharacterized hydrophobic protein (TIGR00271 family)
MMSFLQKLLHYLKLDSELEDFDKIHQSIEKDIVFKGTNLWILVFAIIIASVGLNMNSTAVIIGAMLISPLMGPINGIGYSIATYNFPLFRRALKNFGFAVGAGLTASTAYFTMSPVSTAHSELLARTSPTIYDVLIAFFGGLAGIVAISSKHKGNVIPGVAIATALMPPLCTAGYGLATAQFDFFFGAIYLFTINTVFIGLSAVIVSQLLKFPIITIGGESHKIRVNQSISFVIAITIIPSIYFGYRLVQQERFTENTARFVRSVSIFEGNYLLKQEINPSRRTITLIYGGSALDEEHKQMLKERLKDFSLENATLKVQQGFSLQDGSTNELEEFKIEISRLANLLSLREKEKDSLIMKTYTGKILLNELSALYPAITACTYAETKQFSMTGTATENVALVTLSVKNKGLRAQDKERIYNWLQQRLGAKTVKVYYETGK